MTSSSGATSAALELLRAGKAREALPALEQEVRADASDAKRRIFLFQLLCVLGDWKRAAAQAEVAGQLDATSLPMVRLAQDAIRCEALRAEVFAGKRQPLLFGEPPEWVGWLLQALQVHAAGQHEAAAELRARAFDAAPAIPGSINDKPFEWIADADQRLGPVVEAYVEGKYFWVPFERIAEIRIDEPTSLADVIWTPAQFTWSNGGTAVGLIPTRYPGSESSDDLLRLARRTDWADAGGGLQVGLGQRTFVTDVGDVPLLETRSLTLSQPGAESDNGDGGGR